MKIHFIATILCITLAAPANADQTIEQQRSWCYKGQAYACALAAKKELAANKKKSARVLYKKGCDMGEEVACVGLASLNKIEGRHKEALNQFEKSCERKNAEACIAWAELEMVAGKKQKTMSILTQACNELGSKEACAILDRAERAP